MNKDKNYYLNLLKKFSNYSFLEELFALNLVLSIFGMGYALLEALFYAGGPGFFLLILPVIVCIFSLPQILGRVLVSMNKKRNSRIILIFMFIASIFSIMSIFSFYGDNGGILFFANIICSVILTIILLLKLIVEKNNISMTICCKNCHKKLKHGDAFCSNCGTKVE